MKVKIDAALKFPLTLSMSCESEGDAFGSCQASMNLQKTFAKLNVGQWQTVAIDLACFANKGVKFDQLVTPFELRTKAKLTLSVSNISFESSKDADAELTCE